MARLQELLRNEIEREIEAGTSLNNISKNYSVAKSTLYYHYKKIKGKKFVSPNVKPKFSEKEGEILGIFAGDGSQYFDRVGYHYQTNIHFGGHNLLYACYVQKLLNDFFKKTFQLSRDRKGTLRLRTDSKEIFNYFKTYIEYDSRIKHCTVKLKKIRLPLEFKVGFLRGLVDTDGCIQYPKKSKTALVAFYTTSKELIRQVSSIFSELGLEHSVGCKIDKRTPLHNDRKLSS